MPSKQSKKCRPLQAFCINAVPPAPKLIAADTDIVQLSQAGEVQAQHHQRNQRCAVLLEVQRAELLVG